MAKALNNTFGCIVKFKDIKKGVNLDYSKSCKDCII